MMTPDGDLLGAVFEVAIGVEDDCRFAGLDGFLSQQYGVPGVLSAGEWRHLARGGEFPMSVVQFGELRRKVRLQLGDGFWQIIVVFFGEFGDGWISVPEITHEFFQLGYCGA